MPEEKQRKSMRTSELDKMINKLRSLDRVDGTSEYYKNNAIAYLSDLANHLDGLSELSSNLTKTNTVLENRKPIFIDSTAQGTVNLDTNSFLKSGVTYAFIVIVSSDINSESYKQEISCALNSVNLGNNGNYYKLVSTFAGKCTKGDKIQITSYKNGGSWNGFATRAIFIPVS